jgi:DNA-binding GntR family transcriptional regulator
MNKTPVDNSSVDQVLTFARQRIVSGEYPPDSKLLPKILAAECGTSLIPAREAMRVLESEGLVVFIHNRGAFVAPLSLSELNELYKIRIELETEAVRSVAKLTSTDIKKLREILRLSSVANDAKDKREVIKLNQNFHFSIYRHSNSPLRIRLIETLWLHSERYQRYSLEFRENTADMEHLAIVEALARDDSAAAATALEQHLLSTVALLNKAWSAWD